MELFIKNSGGSIIKKTIVRNIKAIINSKKAFFALFSLNVFIGLVCPYTIQILNYSIEEGILSRAQELLGSDLRFVSRFPFTAEKKQEIADIVGGHQQKSEGLALYTMSSSERFGRLVHLKSFSPPFYGSIRTRHGQRVVQRGEIWVSPELLQSYQLQVGNFLQVGGHQYKISDVIERDIGEVMQMGNLAPSIYLSKEDIEAGGFLSFGSTVRYFYDFKLAARPKSEWVEQVQEKLNDNSVRLMSSAHFQGQGGKVVGYVLDFMGIVSLSTLVLSLVVIYYLIQSFLRTEKKNIRSYSILGLSLKNIQMIYFGVFLVAASLGVLLAIAFLFPAYLTITFLAKKLFISEVAFHFPLQRIGILLLFGPLFTGLLALPLVQQKIRLYCRGQLLGIKIFFASLLPLLILCSCFAIHLSQSYKLGLSLSAFVSVCSLALTFLLLKILPLLSKIAGRTKIFSFRHALFFLTRKKEGTIICCLCLFFCSVFFSFVPAVKQGILNEISVTQTSMPSLFLMDIQPHQINDLQSLLQAQGVKVEELSPLIRGRLTKINNTPLALVKKGATKDDEREREMRNRGVNLSYRPKLNTSEKIIVGQSFSANAQIPEVSLEERYAQRIGAKMGDNLTFDLFGSELVAKVVSIRQVRWTSFLPNFFILFDPTTLLEAPKTFIAAVTFLGERKIGNLQVKMYDQFPNISSIDVEETIKDLLEIFKKVALAVEVLTYFSLGIASLVILAVVFYQLVIRKKDYQIMSLLGVSARQMSLMITIELMSIVFGMTLVGSLMGAMAGNIILAQFFSVYESFNFWSWASNDLLVLALFVLVLIPLIFYFHKKIRFEWT